MTDEEAEEEAWTEGKYGCPGNREYARRSFGEGFRAGLVARSSPKHAERIAHLDPEPLPNLLTLADVRAEIVRVIEASEKLVKSEDYSARHALYVIWKAAKAVSSK